MGIETWWQRLGCTRNPGAHSGEDVARDEEISELRDTIEFQAQEVLKLHRDLAAEKLRVDQGWHRYEAANLRKNELEAERANWAQEIAALKAAAPVATPDSWNITREGKYVVVQKAGVGGYASQRGDDNIASSILFHLASDMLRSTGNVA